MMPSPPRVKIIEQPSYLSIFDKFRQRASELCSRGEISATKKLELDVQIELAQQIDELNHLLQVGVTRELIKQ